MQNLVNAEEEPLIRTAPSCPYCGSTDVAIEGAGTWDICAQEWVLSTTHDVIICQDCDCEFYEEDALHVEVES